MDLRWSPNYKSSHTCLTSNLRNVRRPLSRARQVFFDGISLIHHRVCSYSSLCPPQHLFSYPYALPPCPYQSIVDSPPTTEPPTIDTRPINTKEAPSTNVFVLHNLSLICILHHTCTDIHTTLLHMTRMVLLYVLNLMVFLLCSLTLCFSRIWCLCSFSSFPRHASYNQFVFFGASQFQRQWDWTKAED
jgi:hypothetical protein